MGTDAQKIFIAQYSLPIMAAYRNDPLLLEAAHYSITEA